jgi:hypothetical protein
MIADLVVTHQVNGFTAARMSKLPNLAFAAEDENQVFVTQQHHGAYSGTPHQLFRRLGHVITCSRSPVFYKTTG